WKIGTASIPRPNQHRVLDRLTRDVPHALGLGVTVFTVIFLLELPDKTALAVLLLATRHRPFPIVIGTSAAFLVQSAVAVAAGSLLSLLPREPIRIGAGILFLVMAAVLIRQNLKKTEVEERGEVEREERRHRRPLITAFLVVFVAEWGDLTQLATAALQARYRDPVIVFTAATLALWMVTAIAVILGNRLGAWIPQRPLQLGAAGVMVLVAIALISGVLG
ncbi:MAG TPA: TMEM165/GDT1 family protein, partial [Candidatus Dormibacteraeota bacterium]|nr:TMEM165/GDT1 family protein [Candidatus Dormibacteraeota bacterium]